MKIGWELTEESAKNMRYKLIWRGYGTAIFFFLLRIHQLRIAWEIDEKHALQIIVS